MKKYNDLIAEANALLDSWEDIYKTNRSYGDHNVDVKRYNKNDDFSLNTIIKKLKASKYKTEIEDYFNDEYIDNLYFDVFLSSSWDQLNYELADIEAITEGSKDEQKTFKHIKRDKEDDNLFNDSIIFSAGRLGGWACFNSEGEDYAEDLRYLIDQENTDFLEDIQETMEALSETIEEVEYIINYIKRYNNNLSFSYFLEDQVSQYYEEVKEEEEAKIDNIPALARYTEPKLEDIKKYVNKYIKDEEIKKISIRQANALISAIKKQEKKRRENVKK